MPLRGSEFEWPQKSSKFTKKASRDERPESSALPCFRFPLSAFQLFLLRPLESDISPRLHRSRFASFLAFLRLCICLATKRLKIHKMSRETRDQRRDPTFFALLSPISGLQAFSAFFASFRVPSRLCICLATKRLKIHKERVERPATRVEQAPMGPKIFYSPPVTRYPLPIKFSRLFVPLRG